MYVYNEHDISSAPHFEKISNISGLIIHYIDSFSSSPQKRRSWRGQCADHSTHGAIVAGLVRRSDGFQHGAGVEGASLRKWYDGYLCIDVSM